MSRKVQVILEVTSKGMNSFAKVSGSLDRFNSKLTNTFKSIVNLPNAIAGAAVAGMATQLLKADMQMQGITNRLDAAIGKFTSTQEEMEYLKEEANRLGISFVNLAHSYSGFSASATRAGLSLEDTREIFKNIAETSVSLTLSGDKTRMVFLALEQMASKGKVSMEELRRQLGEHLPGALEIAARSMGMTTREFNKAISNGEIFAYDFLPKFSKAVREQLGGSFDTATEQLLANTQRWQTSFFFLKQKIGEALNPIANEILKNIIDKMENWTKKLEENKGRIIEAIDKIPEHFDNAYNAVSKFVVFIGDHKEALYMVGLAYAMGKVAKAILSIKAAVVALTAAAKAHPFIAIAAGVATLIKVSEKTHDAKMHMYDVIDEETINQSIEAGKKYSQQMYDQSKNQYESEIKNKKQYSSEMLGITRMRYEKSLKMQSDFIKKSKEYEKITPPVIGTGGKGGGKSKKVKGDTDKYRLFDYQPGNVWARFAMVSPELKDQTEEFKAYQDKTLQELYEKYSSFEVKIMTTEEVMAQRSRELWKDHADYIGSSMKSAFMTLVSIDGTFKEKVTSIMRGFYDMSMSMLYDWIAEYIKAKAYEASVGITTEREKQAANISTAVTAGAGAAAEGGKSVASIPYVGPILAIAAFASIFGAIMAIISQAKNYAVGTRYAPSGWAWVGERGPELMKMRGGEQVIPNDRSSGMGSTVNFNVTVNGNADKQTMSATVQEMKKFAQTYYNAMRFNYLKPSYVR